MDSSDFPNYTDINIENARKDTSCKLSLSKLSSSKLNSVSYRTSIFPLLFIVCLLWAWAMKAEWKKKLGL